MRTISVAGLAFVFGGFAIAPYRADGQASLSDVQRSAIVDSVATVMDSVFALSSRPDLDRNRRFRRQWRS